MTVIDSVEPSGGVTGSLSSPGSLSTRGTVAMVATIHVTSTSGGCGPCLTESATVVPAGTTGSRHSAESPTVLADRVVVGLGPAIFVSFDSGVSITVAGTTGVIATLYVTPSYLGSMVECTFGVISV